MRCWQARRQLPRYEDGDLSPHQAAQLEKHLATCTACSAQLRQLRRAVASVEALGEVEVAPDFSDRVMAAIASESVVARAAQPASRPALWPISVPLALGAFVMAATITILALSIDFAALASLLSALDPAASLAAQVASVTMKALIVSLDAVVRSLTTPALVLVGADLALLGLVLAVWRLWTSRRPPMTTTMLAI